LPFRVVIDERSNVFVQEIGARSHLVVLVLIQRHSIILLVTSGCCAGRLEGCSPPEQVVDHYICGLLKLSEPFIYVAALEMSPKSGDGNVDGRASRGYLNLDHRFPELLDATRTHGAAIAHEGSGL